MKLTPHEQKILEIVQSHPEIIHDPAQRNIVAEKHGITEKTLRNRIADLKKYGVIGNDLVEDATLSTMGKPEGEMLKNIELFWKKRKLIFWNTFGFAILSIIISLLLPKWYASKAIIVSSGGGQTNFLSMLSGLPVGDFGLAPLNEDISSYIAILESRSVREPIVNKFNLVERYDSRDIEYAMEALGENVELSVGDEGTLTVQVLDKDPVVARDMTEAMLEELDKMNRKIRSEKGQFTRQFLEERLKQNREDLADAEEKFKQYQQTSGLIDIPSQVGASIEAFTLVYAQKVETEIQYKVASNLKTKTDPQVKQLKLLLMEIDNQLSSMINEVDGDKVMLPFNELPESSLNYARLYREVEIQNKILEIILPQYEQARMEETKNIPSIQIIDHPQVAINKFKPKRAYIVIAATMMAFLLSFVFIYADARTLGLRNHLKKL